MIFFTFVIFRTNISDVLNALVKDHTRFFHEIETGNDVATFKYVLNSCLTAGSDTFQQKSITQNRKTVIGLNIVLWNVVKKNEETGLIGSFYEEYHQMGWLWTRFPS